MAHSLKFFRTPALTTIAALIVMGCATGDTKKSLTRTERSRILVEAANGALLENDPTGALQLLSQAENENSDLPELYHSRAIAYYAKKEIGPALQATKQALSLKPDYTDANNTLGKLLIDLGDLKAAETPLLRAAGDHLYRESYKPHTNLGILYYKQSRFDEAERHLSKAIYDAPAVSCVAFYYRGHVNLRKGLTKSAISDYSAATNKFCAKMPDAHMALARVYERDNDLEHARKKYLDITQNFPNTKFSQEAMERLKNLP